MKTKIFIVLFILSLLTGCAITKHDGKIIKDKFQYDTLYNQPDPYVITIFKYTF